MPFEAKKLFSCQKNVPLRRHGEVRGAVIIQSADENSFTLPPRHLSLANQRSSIVEERADLIGVASAWGGRVVRARLLHISSMAACYGLREY